ncbi:RluA family pseudouridine synthase [PVC group bacterium]|nr:RluA family pseudouridine synthase [PVC group bacterium]
MKKPQNKNEIIVRDTEECKLVHFLSRALKITRRRAKSLIDARQVFVNNKRTWMASHLLEKGDVVEWIRVEKPDTKTQDFRVLFEDTWLMAVDKPPFITTTGKSSMEYLLKRRDKCLSAIHRLDRDTSGVVLFAKNQEVFEGMKKLFRSHKVRKIYRVIVRGKLLQQNITIKKALDGKQALTKVKRLKTSQHATSVECDIVTGRKHQIRRHLAAIGHAVLGDQVYDVGPIRMKTFRRIPRQMIHASQVSFRSPFNGKAILISSKLPKDFEGSLKMVL